MFYFQRIKKFFIFFKKYTRGINKELIGDYDKAILNLLWAVSLNYNYSPVYKALIRLNKRKRFYQNALDYAETACEKFPKDSFFYAQRADIYRNMHEYERAIEQYDKAVLIDDKCIDYYKYRAQIKYYINDIQGSINDYNGAIIREKKSSDLYSQRAFYRFENKNYQSAIDDYTKAIKLKPKKAHLYFMRSCAYKLLNENQQAEKDMQMYKAFIA